MLDPGVRRRPEHSVGGPEYGIEENGNIFFSKIRTSEK